MLQWVELLAAWKRATARRGLCRESQAHEAGARRVRAEPLIGFDQWFLALGVQPIMTQRVRFVRISATSRSSRLRTIAATMS